MRALMEWGLRLVVALLVALGGAVAAAAAAEKGPNIVLIVSDDMGYSDLGCYGGEIDTPNLDALALGGLRFSNYYVNNMCWPTRASLMTGLYPRSAFLSSRASGIRPEWITLPEALKNRGYGTYMAGKWHLSDSSQDDGPGAPHHQGFDQFYGTLEGASDFFAPYGLQLNGRRVTHEWENRPDYYYTDAITDYGIGFLEEHRQAHRGKRPFFLYLAYNAAHWPLHARPEDIARYRGKYAMGWDELRRERHRRLKEIGMVDPAWPLTPRPPNVPAWEQEEHPDWQQRRMEVYAAQITRMDHNIGRVVARLKAMGIFDETLILFQHDNGGCHVEYPPERTGSWTRPFTTDGRRLPIRPGNLPTVEPGPQTSFQSYGYGWANASNTPFRLYKQFDHEGGTRSPLIVSWPREIDSGRTGAIVRTFGHAIDMMPTLLAAAGGSDGGQGRVPFEGRSLLPAIRGRAFLGARARPLFWAHSQGRAVRFGDWKLVAYRKRPWELYYLVQDGVELNDVADVYPGKVREMAAWHAAWVERTRLRRP